MRFKKQACLYMSNILATVVCKKMIINLFLVNTISNTIFFSQIQFKQQCSTTSLQLQWLLLANILDLHVSHVGGMAKKNILSYFIRVIIFIACMHTVILVFTTIYHRYLGIYTMSIKILERLQNTRPLLKTR
jgi:hypothetical protein